MNLDVYRHFIIVADCRRISEAAEKICITQPALSKQIKSLESMYDTPLFQRGPKGLTLTTAGKILYARSKMLCRIEDETKYEINCTSKESDTINIGMSSGIALSYWMRILAELHNSNPNACFNVHEGESDTILGLLQESILDVGIIDKQPPSSFRIISATNEKPVLVSSFDGPWLASDASAFHIADLQDVPVCITKGHLDRFVEACRNEGFFPNVIFTSTSRRAVMEWALGGKAIAVMLQSDKAYCKSSNARFASLDCPSLESETLVVARKNQTASPLLQQVISKVCSIS